MVESGDCIQFKRDDSGKLDVKGKFAKKPEILNVKYDEEVHFCLGAGVVQIKMH